MLVWLHPKGGYVCLSFQPINIIMNDLNQLNCFWISCSSINQKRIHDYFDIPKWHNSIWSAKTILKNQIMSFFGFFAPPSFIFLSKPLECRFVINKINLIIIVNTSVLWKNLLLLNASIKIHRGWRYGVVLGYRLPY